MKAFLNRIFDFFNTIESKIAFYPTLLAIVGLLIALIMMYLEGLGVSKKILDIAPQLMVENGDTALTVLSACLGGLISLMVFSFSMVMLLLSQASNNFSPRLLPGLISDKRHQLILGIFLATILYIIFTLFTIQPSEEKYTLPGVSVLLGIVFTITCLVAFIYFIHNISQSIQVNNILDNIFMEAKERLSILVKADDEMSDFFPSTDDWYEYKVNHSGYFQNASTQNILRLCERNGNRIYIVIPKGLFILSNGIFLKSEKKLEKEELDALLSNISFSRGELVEDNYTLAFKQITEIAVKAMSPGINDPGTAVNAVDYLTELFSLRMKKTDQTIFSTKGAELLRIATISFQELMYNIMASLRTYCQHDPTMMQKLLWMLTYLEEQPSVDDQYHKVIIKEKEELLAQAKTSLDSEWDYENLTINCSKS